MSAMKLGKFCRLALFVIISLLVVESQQRPGNVFKDLKIDMSNNLLLKKDQNLKPLLRNINKRSVNSDNFDYVVFRQIWPATSCMFVKPPTTCAIGKDVDSWVVHGLWPSDFDHMGPMFCNKSMGFDFDKIKWLLPRLNKYWPNLYTNTPTDSFWKHEWEKHGTCAIGLPDVHDESGYFNVSLGLRDHFDFGPMLKANEIVPDDDKTYDLTNLKQSVKSLLNVTPFAVCYWDKEKNVQYLSQMQICLSKEFDLVECKSGHVDMLELRPSQSLVKGHSQVPKNNNNDVVEIPCHDNLPIHYPSIKH